MWEPEPVSLNEPLPKPATGGLCTRCRRALYYQRVERRIRHERHFYFCRLCRLRFAAWETEWQPHRASK